MMKYFLEALGIGAIIIIIILICLVPLVCTAVLGTYLATNLGLTGIVWWSFVILFWLIICGLLSLLTKKT